MQQLKLVDLDDSNDIYTWNNKRLGNKIISCQLDHFLVSDSIIMKGGEMTTMVLPLAGSYHSKISMYWERIGVNLRIPFHFEQLWILHPKFSEKLKQWWVYLSPFKGVLM